MVYCGSCGTNFFFFFPQFGNSVTNTPVKRRKVAQSDGPSEPLPVGFATCESIIVHCRNIRVGTLYRTIVEPVVVSI